MPQGNKTSNKESILDRVKADFSLFQDMLWQWRGFKPATTGQKILAHELQYGPSRQVISMGRGIGKSDSTKAYVLWRLLRNDDRDERIIIISATKPLAHQFSRFLLQTLRDCPFLQHLAPQGDQLQSTEMFDIAGATMSPSVRCLGITSQVTGSRASLIVYDDCETSASAGSDVKREYTLHQMQEAEAVLVPPNEGDSRVIVLGTPHTTLSMYRTLDYDRGYSRMIFPAQYPSLDKLDRYDGRLHHSIYDDLKSGKARPGDSTDERFSLETLAEKRRGMTSDYYQLQYLLDTTASDESKYQIKLRDLIVEPLGEEVYAVYSHCNDERNLITGIDIQAQPGDRLYRALQTSGELEPFTETIVSVDPASEGSDETVAVVMSQHRGNIFIRDILGIRGNKQAGSSRDTLRAIVNLAKKYKAGKLLVETNLGGSSFMELLKREVAEAKGNIAVDGVRVFSNKENRIIDAVAPISQRHSLIVDPKVFRADSEDNRDIPESKRIAYYLSRQMSFMCRERGAVAHDDRIDAIAQGCIYFNDAIAQSASLQLHEKNRRELDARNEALTNYGKSAIDVLVTGGSFAHFLETRPATEVYNWTEPQ